MSPPPMGSPADSSVFQNLEYDSLLAQLRLAFLEYINELDQAVKTLPRHRSHVGAIIDSLDACRDSFDSGSTVGRENVISFCENAAFCCYSAEKDRVQLVNLPVAQEVISLLESQPDDVDMCARTIIYQKMRSILGWTSTLSNYSLFKGPVSATTRPLEGLLDLLLEQTYCNVSAW